MNSSKRYIVGEWSHIFPGGRAEDLRLAIDAGTNRITAMQVFRDGEYSDASRFEIAEVQDSLKSSNEGIFTEPEDFGLSIGEQLPVWAAPANPVASRRGIRP